LYFSRAPIPWNRDASRDAQGWPVSCEGALRHLGIYAYRAASLSRFAAAPSSGIEETERLEQLRALWLGMTIRTASAARTPPRGVDTESDLAELRRLHSRSE